MVGVIARVLQERECVTVKILEGSRVLLMSGPIRSLSKPKRYGRRGPTVSGDLFISAGSKLCSKRITIFEVGY